MGETGELGSFVAETTYDDVPSTALEAATDAIRDYVGVALYGSRQAVGERICSYVEASMPGDAATVIGRGTASPTGAALANGTFGHAVDYDDTFESIVIHPTSPTFPAALAAAEHVAADGRALMTAYVLGAEAAFRVGHGTYPSHYDNGWHGTGTVGTFGAAAAAASVMGLDVETVARAFGIAASGSSSLKKNFGSMTKPLHAGHAAQMGVRAAFLAAEGFTADAAVLEGKLGYGSVMTPGGEYDPAAITDGLGEEWAVSDVGFKPYPSGVITHAAMDALRALLVREDIGVSDVESITVTLDDAAEEMLIHADPDDALEAKFSIEFCLAAVLRERDPGIREFTDAYVSASETRSAMARVERAFESDLFGQSYAGYGARVVMTTVGGEEHVAEERHAPGSPTNPVGEERLREKFTECATAVLSAEEAEAVAEAIEELEEPSRLGRFLDAVR